MAARTRASLLWGLVGALSFLVLAQGTRLVIGLEVGLPSLGGVALGVFVAATAASHLLGRRLDRKRQL